MGRRVSECLVGVEQASKRRKVKMVKMKGGVEEVSVRAYVAGWRWRTVGVERGKREGRS